MAPRDEATNQDRAASKHITTLTEWPELFALCVKYSSKKRGKRGEVADPVVTGSGLSGSHQWQLNSWPKS